jgi:Ca2+/Na+ antiporter
LQILICNYLHVTPYVMLSILPVMILMLPIRFGTFFAMILAFVSGLAVDFLSEGVIGLNALALVPVALARKGIIYLIFGSEFFVDGATYVAHRYGVRQSVIGLTIVAGGTSLPELATSVVAAYKGKASLAIGNAIGSNVFNIFLVLGVTAVICPMRIMGITIIDLMMMLVSIGILWIFAYTKYFVSRREGVLMIAGFLAYMCWLFYLL